MGISGAPGISHLITGQQKCLFHQNQSSSVRWTPPAVTPHGGLQDLTASYGPPVRIWGWEGPPLGQATLCRVVVF